MDEPVLNDILDLIRRPVSSELLSHLSDQASLVIPCQKSNLTTPAGSVVLNDKYGALPPLPSFIGFLVKRSSVRPGTLLGALVFLKRLRQSLSTVAKGMPCTAHRIFLATLIVTSKSLHDTSPKNKHWAKYAAYFTLLEINLMEKQLLSLMDYHVLISPTDLSDAYNHFRYSTALKLYKQLPSKPDVVASFTKIDPNEYLYNTLETSLLSKPMPVILSTSVTRQINDADIPTYAVAYSSTLASNNLSNVSLLSSASSDTDSSLDDNHIESLGHQLYQMNSAYPQKAHCRDRQQQQQTTFIDYEDIAGQDINH